MTERIVDIVNAYKILVGKPEEKVPFVRPRRRWENNIKVYLQRN
jgi:hypothetical protein